MSRKYFGTDGIRGRVGEGPISADFVLRLGNAYGHALREAGVRPDARAGGPVPCATARAIASEPAPAAPGAARSRLPPCVGPPHGHSPRRAGVAPLRPPASAAAASE